MDSQQNDDCLYFCLQLFILHGIFLKIHSIVSDHSYSIVFRDSLLLSSIKKCLPSERLYSWSAFIDVLKNISTEIELDLTRNRVQFIKQLEYRWLTLWMIYQNNVFGERKKKNIFLYLLSYFQTHPTMHSAFYSVFHWEIWKIWKLLTGTEYFFFFLCTYSGTYVYVLRKSLHTCLERHRKLTQTALGHATDK